jgi:hypothetical protein
MPYWFSQGITDAAIAFRALAMQARIRFASNDLQQFLDPVTPLRSHMPSSAKCARMALLPGSVAASKDRARDATLTGPIAQ